jgi:transcription initiation factor IIF auxiliary subunit
LLIGLTTANTKAEDAIYLQKDKPAPFTGILFPEQQARQLRNDLLEASKVSLQLENERFKITNLHSIIQLKDQEIELYAKQNQRLVKQEQTSQTMQYVWFGLGILATGAAVYGAGALSR